MRDTVCSDNYNNIENVKGPGDEAMYNITIAIRLTPGADPGVYAPVVINFLFSPCVYLCFVSWHNMYIKEKNCSTVKLGLGSNIILLSNYIGAIKLVSMHM